MTLTGGTLSAAVTAAAKLEPFHAFVAIIGLLCLYSICIIIYRLYFHPLASYPGPFLGKISDLYMIYIAFNRTRSFKQYELLRKYGSPIRITTNSLLFADAKAWTDIYGQSANPCLKDPAFYNAIRPESGTNILGESDRIAHSRIRRILSHSFSARAILEQEPLLARKVETYAEVVFGHTANNPSEPVEIYHKTHDHYFDIVSELSFGMPFNSLTGETPTQYTDIEHFVRVVPLRSAIPYSDYLPLKFIQEGWAGVRRLQSTSRQAVLSFLNRLEKQDSNAQHEQFLKRLVTAVDPETGSKLTIDELVENVIVLLVAGTGTTSVTTSYLIWEVSTRPDIRAKLTKEIRDAFPDLAVSPTYTEASKLPYLNAVIEETLRIWGPVNSNIPRISPGRVIAGHFIPKGVSMSISSYATARDSDVFPDPLSFKPERWLDATPEMREMSRPFSTGPRNCIGKHLANVNLILTLSRIFQLYNITTHPSMTKDMMRAIDLGPLEPRGAKLLVNVTRA